MMRRSARSRSFFRKMVVNGVNNSKTAIQNDCLMRLYDADSELKAISSELDSFDGKKDPVRCNLLVNQLRTAQDKVISLLFQLMDDCNCERASRDYRMKFPDEILLSEGSESLNGQIWFGAECLSAGSNILNHNKESTMLRPMAKTLTQHLDSLRNDLRDLVIDGSGAMRINETLIKKMVAFDHIFASFEYEYVKTMLPIRTVAEIEKLQEVAVLFSETLIDCLKRGLIKQDDIDEFQPIVMIAIPRLAIVRGLLYKNDNPIYTRHKSHMCSLFQPFHGPLHSIRKLIRGLHPSELLSLERMLANDQSTSEENDKKEKSAVAPTEDNNKTIVRIADGANTYQDEHLEPGTSTGNYTNVLMDGLQYPVGQKRASADEGDIDQPAQSPSHQEFDCYLEVQPSSSKFNMDDRCVSPSADVAVPSPSTSLNSPSRSTPVRVGCARDEDSTSNHDEDAKLGDLADDADKCCLLPPESDAQLERLIADFSPSMSDGPEIKAQDDAGQQHEEQDLKATEESESRKETSKVNNEEEMDKLFQKQAQQLLHRLFVAISGVADQLQSNFASDLRFILRHIFSSEIAGDVNNSDEEERLDNDHTYDEAYADEEDEEYEAEYSNEQSDSSLPIEQGIEARETNLIDLESGYTLMDSLDRAAGNHQEPLDTSLNEPSYPFNDPNNPIEEIFPPPPPPPPQDSVTQQVNLDSSQHVSNAHYNQISEAQLILQNALDQRQMNHEMLADLMRASNHQNLAYGSGGDYESPNEPSLMESSQYHQRLMQQHLQSIARATNRIHASSAAASAASTAGYGHNMVDGNSSHANYHHQVSSNHRERRSRHHGSSRSRRMRGPPVWVPDQDVIQCSTCNAPFTLFRRRHHCRACGQIFCADCSKFTKNLSCWGYSGPVRVCRPCYDQP